MNRIAGVYNAAAENEKGRGKLIGLQGDIRVKVSEKIAYHVFGQSNLC